MKIVFHLGIHCTDGGLLIRSILQNRSRLAAEGVWVPGPLDYRERFGAISTALRGQPASAEIEEELVDAITGGRDPDRVVLSNENFLCRSDAALDGNGLYPKAAKSAWLRKCLPSHEAEFAIAIRNPAGFLPDLMSGRAGPAPGEDLLGGAMLLDDLRWSEVIRRLQAANPGCPVTVWCHEDTPFIWGQLIAELTGQDALADLDGACDMAETIMTPEGYRRLTEFLDRRKIASEAQRRQAMSAFLEAHAIADRIEDEIDLPGWTEETVDALTDLYDEDVEIIERMPGVTFLMP